MTNLQHAAKTVIERWDNGDLAEAVRMLHEAFDIEVPAFAKLDGNNLVCDCGTTDKPTLIELGYDVTHEFQKVEDGEIVADGWGGDSRDVSEGIEDYRLECANCGARFQLPEGMGVDWQ